MGCEERNCPLPFCSVLHIPLLPCPSSRAHPTLQPGYGQEPADGCPAQPDSGQEETGLPASQLQQYRTGQIGTQHPCRTAEGEQQNNVYRPCRTGQVCNQPYHRRPDHRLQQPVSKPHHLHPRYRLHCREQEVHKRTSRKPDSHHPPRRKSVSQKAAGKLANPVGQIKSRRHTSKLPPTPESCLQHSAHTGRKV